LGNKQRVTLTRVFERIDEVLDHASVGMVDLYGGEPLLLPPEYINALKAGLHARGIDDLNIITNLSMNNPVVNDVDWYITVSYDFEAREQHDHVFQQMLKMERGFSILILATPTVLAKDPDEIIDTLNLLANLESVEIKPYSPNQANQLPVSYHDFEALVQTLYVRQDRMKFDFVNASQIHESLNGERSAWSDDHVYLTPTGQFGVLEFDEHENEYFLELDSIQAYFDWCVLEKARVRASGCNGCRFFGGCLSEHLRDVQSTVASCNGFIHLLEWAETQ
jgi:sulfatase maturation enzyme AslB (radical SAM superfamily)